jgi:integrase
MNDLFIRYANEISETKKGARWEVVRLNMFARFALAEVKLVDLRREHLEIYISERLKSVEPSSVNRELNLISHCLTQARRWRLMSHNPMDDLRRPKDPPPRDRMFSQAEIDALLTVLDYDSGPVVLSRQRVALALLFAFETAMRAGEICSIVAKHINLNECTVHLPKTKNGLPRTVPLSPKAIELLKRFEPWGDNPVFGLKSGVLSTIFTSAVKKAGIENLTFHDSRHEATTRLAKTFDVLQLARITGHKDLKQLMTYYNETAANLAKKFSF